MTFPVSDDSMDLNGLAPGRIVHYVLESGEHRSAHVIRVSNIISGECTLLVLCDPTYDHRSDVFELVVSCPPSDKLEPGTWHWIEGSINFQAHEALLKRIHDIHHNHHSESPLSSEIPPRENPR